jgi:hypothetical protein
MQVSENSTLFSSSLLVNLTANCKEDFTVLQLLLVPTYYCCNAVTLSYRIVVRLLRGRGVYEGVHLNARRRQIR